MTPVHPEGRGHTPKPAAGTKLRPLIQHQWLTPAPPQPACPPLPSETSIVDSTPGTTADTKVVLMELHDVGPAKLFDTGQPPGGGQGGQWWGAAVDPQTAVGLMPTQPANGWRWHAGWLGDQRPWGVC